MRQRKELQNRKTIKETYRTEWKRWNYWDIHAPLYKEKVANKQVIAENKNVGRAIKNVNSGKIPNTTLEEFDKGLKEAKNNKAPGEVHIFRNP